MLPLFIELLPIPFNEITTDNMVEKDLLVLSDRLTTDDV